MKISNIIFSLALAAVTAKSLAGEVKPYSPNEFDKLSQAGKPVLVDFNASWCPTCKAQKPILESLMQKPSYRDVTMLVVDFDTDSEALKRFSVRSQSTLIAFKGATEVGRSVGDTSRNGIESLVKRTAN